MVNVDGENVIFIGQLNEEGTQQWAATKIKRPRCILQDEAACLSFAVGSGRKIHHRHVQHQLRRDYLYRDIVLREESRAQNFMTANDLVEAGVEGFSIKRAAQPKCPGNVEQRIVGFELIE